MAARATQHHRWCLPLPPFPSRPSIFAVGLMKQPPLGGPAQIPIAKSPRSQKECVNSNPSETTITKMAFRRSIHRHITIMFCIPPYTQHHEWRIGFRHGMRNWMLYAHPPRWPTHPMTARYSHLPRGIACLTGVGVLDLSLP
jgi:hypothetical protein